MKRGVSTVENFHHCKEGTSQHDKVMVHGGPMEALLVASVEMVVWMSGLWFGILGHEKAHGW